MITKEQIKEIFENFYNKDTISSADESVLSNNNLELINNGSEVLLKSSNWDVLISLTYLTVWNIDQSEWDKFDSDFKELSL